MLSKVSIVLSSTQGQAITMAGGQVLITFITVITGLFIARHLIPADYGRFIYYIKLFGVLRLLAALGLTSLVTFETAKARAQPGGMEEAFLPLLVARLTSLAAIVICLLAFGATRSNVPLMIAALTVAPALLMDYFVGILQGIGLVSQTIGVLIGQPIVFGISLVAIGLSEDPVVYLYWAQFISVLCGLGLAILLTHPHVHYRRPEKIAWRGWIARALKIAGGFYVIAIFLTLFNTYPTLLLGSAEHYEATANLTIPLNTVALVPGIFGFVISSVYFPRLTHQHSVGEPEAERQTFQGYFKISGIFTALLALCLMAYPTIFLHLLYGDSYMSSAQYLVILAPTVMLSTLGAGLLWAIVAQGRVRTVLPSVIIPTLLLVASLMIITRLGLGQDELLRWFAAVFTAATALMFVWQYFLIGYSLRAPLSTILRYAVSGTLAIGLMRAFIVDTPSNTLIVLALLGTIGLFFMILILNNEFGISLPARRETKGVIALCALLAYGLLGGHLVANAQEGGPQTIVVTSSPNVAAVAGGEPGVAWFLYHTPEAGYTMPKLAVRLERGPGAGSARALVYETSANSGYIPIEPFENWSDLSVGPISPAVILTAPDGWWVRDGIANYNLDVTVYGQIYSMWNAVEWPGLLDAQTPNAQILVRDTDGDGLPDWDWRTMLPDFPNRGDLRTNYAERKCESPVTIDSGVSPEWPFVAFDGGFEQKAGIFRPPIVVDWATGQIEFFSELVTVRNQNCSYSLYSIERVLPGRLNSPNFETPFAFYDLSGEGVGYPNLLLRTQRTNKDEPFELAGNPETQSIRYSWRNAIGDWEWDYKVDVLGQHQYQFVTPIAGGLTTIDAPPYEAFPEWVIGRDWPAVAFVAVEQSRDQSSEGIYDWSLLGVTNDYYFGREGEPDLSQFEDIRVGIRGEYRLNSTRHPELYLSPIDNRLHLKWAEHGIWRLDDEQIIRVTNLDNEEFIDVWSREAMAVTVGELSAPLPETAVDNVEPPEAEVIESLYALDGYLIHSDNASLSLVAADYQPALFETLPPTNHDTWEAHRALLAPYESQRRDPANLRAWLDPFPGPRSQIAGATLDNLHITNDGFRFELALAPGFRIDGPDLLGLTGLAAGEYLVARRGETFTVTELIPPQPAVEAYQLPDGGPVRVTVSNTGTADAIGLELMVEAKSAGEVVELLRQPIDALAGETAQVLVNVPSTMAGTNLVAQLQDPDGAIVANSATLALNDVVIDHSAIFSIDRAPAMLPIAALFAALLALATLLAATRRRRSVT